MAEKNVLSRIPTQQMPERQGNFLSRMADEAIGAFERYGRRSGAQRDASLALMSQAADPNTDPLTGAGMKALGLAGLVTHPLAFFPTGDEWRERLRASGNEGRMGQAIGGMLGDLPSLIDPQMAAGGALAAAPLIGKMAGKVDDVADAGRASGMKYTREQLEKMDPSELDRMAFGHADGDALTISPSDIKLKYPDDLVNPQDKFDKGGMAWAKSVNFDEPIHLSIGRNGELMLEDGHHRYFAAQKLGRKLPAVIVKSDGKPIEKILAGQ